MPDVLMKAPGVKTPWGIGWLVKPFTQWRRPDGPASFFTDRLALRKSLALCHTCETSRLGSRWYLRYLYQRIESFHGEGIGCDYCRADEPTNLYIPEDGTLAADYREMVPSVKQTVIRDNRMRN